MLTKRESDITKIVTLLMLLVATFAEAKIILPYVENGLPANLIESEMDHAIGLIGDKIFHEGKTKAYSLHFARQMLENSLTAQVLPPLIRLVLEDRYFGSFLRLGKLCELMAKNRLTGDYGLSMQLLRARQLSKNRLVSIEDTYQGNKIVGKVDLTLYHKGSKNAVSVVSLKSIYSKTKWSTPTKFNQLLRKAIDQLQGKYGEHVPARLQKNIEILVLQDENPLFHFTRKELSALLTLDFRDELRHAGIDLYLVRGNQRIHFLEE